MDIFRAENIEKHFTNHIALNKVSINVPEGSIFGLLGPNGAGKTTLLRIINQITAPDKGQIFFKGKKLSPEDTHRIGYLPEERGLYKKMKIGEQAIYLGRLKGLSRHDVLTKLKFWFEKFEIQAWWDKKVEELSKGMQQKVQFIITVIHEPELLIFDEPFSGFDPINANLLKQEILQLQKNGATVIFSTHNMSSVEELCSDISLINKAKIIIDGKIHEVKNQFKSNRFKIEYACNTETPELKLSNKYVIEGYTKLNGSHSATVHINEGSANELLGEIIPQVQVQGFNEIVPNMNEIFIQVVEHANTKSNE